MNEKGDPPLLFVARGEVSGDVVNEWNDWYDSIHLPEILACPGFRGARRYVSSEGEKHLFLSLYEIEHENVMETPEFADARGLGPFGDQAIVKSKIYRHHVTKMVTNSNDTER